MRRAMYSVRAVNAAMPKTVGKYQILDRLAVGGMAELFKATLTGEHGFEKLVAIKKILPHLAADQSFVEMFRDEARITAKLDHRHIVQVFEYGTDADTPYIAMEFVDGLDVLALLRECAPAQIRRPADLAAGRGGPAQGQAPRRVAGAGPGSHRDRRSQRSVLRRHPARRDGDGAPAVHVG